MNSQSSKLNYFLTKHKASTFVEQFEIYSVVNFEPGEGLTGLFGKSTRVCRSGSVLYVTVCRI